MVPLLETSLALQLLGKGAVLGLGGSFIAVGRFLRV
jgi:cell division transport system permease protein